MLQVSPCPARIVHLAQTSIFNTPIFRTLQPLFSCKLSHDRQILSKTAPPHSAPLILSSIQHSTSRLSSALAWIFINMFLQTAGYVTC